MLFSNVHMNSEDTGGLGLHRVVTGGIGGRRGGLGEGASVDREKDAFGRGSVVANLYKELPTPPGRHDSLPSPDYQISLLPHPSFTASIVPSNDATSHVRPFTPTTTCFPPRSPLTPPGGRSLTLVHQLNVTLSSVLWAGDLVTLNEIFTQLAVFDAQVARDVRTSAAQAHAAGKLSEYIRGVIRMLLNGVVGPGRFTLFAFNVEKIITPIHIIIDELLRIRHSTLTSTFQILASLKEIEATPFGLSLDVREISLNRLTSHEVKILHLRDVIGDLRARVDDKYYEDLATSEAFGLAAHTASLNTEAANAGESHPDLIELDEDMNVDHQIGSLFKMLSATSNSVSHIEHAPTITAAEKKIGVVEEDNALNDVDIGRDVHSGHTSSSEEEEDEEVILARH